eukprot:TRINITY_DN16060_c0_g1_i1.p1 TRINITY_DN16060_c0_g1~~TRINITY_DN16060_c0_g1_i1.p1  ORF type:complete len:281 (+),score=62.93 TRINITY_DN16060_c0_g1_i1:58-843(+)
MPTGILLLGNAGVGKTFLLNGLYGGSPFRSAASHAAVTTKLEHVKHQTENWLLMNLPGLVDSNPRRTAQNRSEIERAFQMTPMCIVGFVIGVQGGRIRAEDLATFESLNNAFSFLPSEHASFLFIVNNVPSFRPPEYDQQIIHFLQGRFSANIQVAVIANTPSNFAAQKELQNNLTAIFKAKTARIVRKKAEIQIERDRLLAAQMAAEEAEAARKREHQRLEAKRAEEQRRADAERERAAQRVQRVDIHHNHDSDDDCVIS